MPLNYDKWANLELSDDSDVEVHPNIDKRSFIRWKQRDIHEKREKRKADIERLRQEIALNKVLMPRIQDLISAISTSGSEAFSSLVARLQSSPSPDKPPTGAPNQPTYDEMMSNLCLQVWEQVRKDQPSKEVLGGRLVEELRKHLQALEDRQTEAGKELVALEEEQKKHITSDDVREGFSSGYVNKADSTPAPAQPKKEEKKETAIEVLNPGASTSSTPARAAPESDEEELPELTPSMSAFARIPLRDYRASVEAIGKDKLLLSETTTDALLVEAFNAGMRGDKEYAKQCVHQGLLVQYCNKLGKDGVSVFFKRMTGGGGAEEVFLRDVNDTWSRVMERSQALAQQSSGPQGNEQIQLVAENPSTQISFDVPEGPPPEEIKLEGEALEKLDPAQVRNWLKRRWDIFQSFPKNLQKALESNSLEEVNRVLGRMSVEEAEEVVKQLDEAGILNFRDTDIVDETGKGKGEDGGQAEAGAAA